MARWNVLRAETRMPDDLLSTDLEDCGLEWRETHRRRSTPVVDDQASVTCAVKLLLEHVTSVGQLPRVNELGGDLERGLPRLFVVEIADDDSLCVAAPACERKQAIVAGR